MEVRPGYKQTEVGMIPEDWTLCNLASLSAFITKGSTPTTYGFKWQQSGVLFLRSECVSEDGLDLSQSMRISAAAHTSQRRSQVKDGDLLMTITGNVGRVILFRNPEEANINQHIARVRIRSSQASRDFVYQFLALPQCRKRFSLITTGQAYPQISLKQVREAPVTLPPTLAEQELIAEALSDTDALIDSLEQLLAKKRQLKQGAMQELLTGNRRLPGFSGEWDLRALGEIATTTKGNQLSSSLMTEHGRFAHLNGGISPSGNTDKSNTLGDTIAISEGGNSCGYVQFMSEPYWCGGHCYSVIPNGIDNRFLYHALKREEPSIMGLRVGSGLPNVQKTALLAFELQFPKASEEQTSIAVILSDMDAEIVGLDAKLAKARNIKHGMMQELLTGRIRLV